MKNIVNFIVPFSIGASLCSILLMLNSFVYETAMKEHSIFTVMISLFIPLFLIAFIVSMFIKKMRLASLLLSVSICLLGMFMILIVYLNVYRLQMLLPLVKTNSISMAVMWITRIAGGLIGGLCGFSFGLSCKKSIKYFASLFTGILLIMLFSYITPSFISYESVFYVVGGLCFIGAILNDVAPMKIRKDEI